MRHKLLALLLAAAAETAALACSCRQPPDSDSGRRRLAAELAEGAAALVEVELARPYDDRTGRGERLRVRRTLAGRAPPVVDLERHGRPQSAACEQEFAPGRSRIVILYPPLRLGGGHRVASSCTTFLLADPPMLEAVTEAMRRRR
ncbi:MAG TPA: hypothetical protein VF759_08535 [Allosphingosinicella sp.]|jgi:hypothetical protein